MQRDSPAELISLTIMSLGIVEKPVPVMVKMSPPRALAGMVEAEVMVSGTRMSRTPAA